MWRSEERGAVSSRVASVVVQPEVGGGNHLQQDGNLKWPEVEVAVANTQLETVISLALALYPPSLPLSAFPAVCANRKLRLIRHGSVWTTRFAQLITYITNGQTGILKR